MKTSHLERIRYIKSDNTFMFDFADVTSKNDVIKLESTGLYKSKLFNKVFFYRYNFDDNVSSDIRKQFIEYFKFPKEYNEKDVTTFVKNAVEALDTEINLWNNDVIVFPQSVSHINRMMIKYMYNFGYPNLLTFELIKDTPADIEFDYDRYIKLDLDATHIVGDKPRLKYTETQKVERLVEIENMMKEIQQLDYFSIARNILYKYRQYLKPIYKFKNSSDEESFKALNKNRVIIIDDVVTSGSTISHIINKIQRVNPNVEIIVFSILGKELELN